MAADHAFIGDLEQVFTYRDKMLRTISETSNLFLYGRALVFSIMANALMGRWEEAVAEGKKSLHVAQEVSDNSHISFAAATISVANCLKGDLEQALSFGELAVQKAPTFADQAWSKAYLAYAWCRAGEPNRGVEVLAPMVQTFRAASHAVSELLFCTLLCEGYLLAGKHYEASQTGEEVVRLAERCRARPFLAWAYRLLGEVALTTNPDEAPSYFAQAISIFRDIKAENQLALAYSGMGRYHKQRGNTEEARKHLADALEIFERLGTLIEPDKVRKELAELPATA
jgi:tetratricopeptide (TPR) repeat protein